MAKQINILLVDDSEIILRKMKELLSDVTFIQTIETALNAEVAMEKIRLMLPELVLLDINMPHKNGIELLQDIKQEFPRIKVIMVSSHSAEFYKEMCKDLGAEYFVDKTMEFEKIPALIEAVLSECTLK